MTEYKDCSAATEDTRRKERVSMAREICMHRGENPDKIDRGGNADWEKYEPLAGAVIREAERLFKLRAPAQAGQVPVAWRVKNDFGHWYVTQHKDLADTWRDFEGYEVQDLYAAQPPAAPVENKNGDQVHWLKVNDEPFEYAIQQGPHGDEFVKLLNGECLRRPLSRLSADSAESLRRQLEDTQAELEAWFGFAEGAETEAAPALINGLKSYLRTCQSGGMPKKQADLAMAVLEDYCRLYAGEALAPVLRAIAKNVEIQEAPSLNREGRVHPSYDNPLDPFASPDRLPEQSAGNASERAKAIVKEAWRQTCAGPGEFDDYAVPLIAAALSTVEPQGVQVTEAVIHDIIAEAMDGYGLTWSGIRRASRHILDRVGTSPQTPSMREALVSAQRIIERDFPNGQLAIDIRNALATKPQGARK